MDDTQRRAAAAAAFALLALGTAAATALAAAESETGPVEVLSAAYRETLQLTDNNAENLE